MAKLCVLKAGSVERRQQLSLRAENDSKTSDFGKLRSHGFYPKETILLLL
jgi:hypothetical protein